jgi:hypothetical protein
MVVCFCGNARENDRYFVTKDFYLQKMNMQSVTVITSRYYFCQLHIQNLVTLNICSV